MALFLSQSELLRNEIPRAAMRTYHKYGWPKAMEMYHLQGLHSPSLSYDMMRVMFFLKSLMEYLTSLVLEVLLPIAFGVS